MSEIVLILIFFKSHCCVLTVSGGRNAYHTSSTSTSPCVSDFLTGFLLLRYNNELVEVKRELKSCKAKMETQTKQVQEYSQRLEDYDKKFEESSRKFQTLLTVSTLLSLASWLEFVRKM